MPVRKRFGQHFLHDPRIIQRIVAAVAPKPGERVVEIGPGRGALTFALLEQARELEVVEIDRDLAADLKRDRRAASLKIHVGDVLDLDFAALKGDGAKLRIVGNLPYNISTPLLFKLLAVKDTFEDMHFMLQKEVVERMTASPGGKEYGRLTVMLAAAAETQALFDVGPGAFQPPPRVWSAVVRIKPAAGPRFEFGSERALSALVTAAFSARRKTLRNGLKNFLNADDIGACGIDPQARPETLEPQQFGLLAARYSQLYSKRDGAL
jgi:16S rRNA (adenine1518-N6/adenine1519-N6)-dimethyltransferase